MKNKILHATLIFCLLSSTARAQSAIQSDEFWEQEVDAQPAQGAVAAETETGPKPSDDTGKVTLVPGTDKKNVRNGLGSPSGAMVGARRHEGGANCAPGKSPDKEVRKHLPFEKLQTECLEGRPRVAESFYQIDTFETPREYINSDSNACACMQKTSSAKLSEAQKQPDPDEITLQHLQANVSEKIQRLQSMNEGALVQIMLLVRDKDKAKFLLKRYAAVADKKTKDAIAEYKKNFKKDATEKLKNKTPAALKRINEIVDKIALPDVTNIKPPSSSPAPGSCISMASYLSYQQIPKEQEFFEDLAAMKDEINEDDWNISTLKKNYDIAHRNAEALPDGKDRQTAFAKARGLRARINFLKKNPLIGNVFSLKPQSNAKINEAANLRKKELYRILKSELRPGISVNDYKNFQKKVSSVFSNIRVNALFRTNLNDQTLAEFQGQEAILNTKLPTSQLALESKLSLMSQGQSEVKGCTGVNPRPSLAKCSADYLNYCRLVKDVNDGISKNSANLYSPSENMDLETLYDFDSDPEKNDGFKKFSDEVCKKKRTSRANSQLKMNFEEYRKSVCPENSAKVECDPAFQDSLVRKFMSDTKAEIPEGGDPDVVMAYEQTFLGVLTDLSKVEIEPNDMLEVKLGSVSYTDLSTQGYPSSSLSPAEITQLAAMASKSGEVEEKVAPFKASLDGVKEDVAAPALTTPMFSSASTAAAPAVKDKEDKKTLEEVEEERSAIKQKIRKGEDELEKARKVDDKGALAEMEKRLQTLTDLLAKNEQDYKKLYEEREREKEKGEFTKSKSKKKGSTGIVDEGSEEDKSVGGKVVKTPSSGGEDGGAFGRTPASVPEGNFVSTDGNFAASKVGGSARAAVSAGKIKGGTGLFNAALLEKYGIVLDGPTEGTVLLAPEKGDKELKKITSAQEGQSIPLVVSQTQYEGIKTNDLDTLKDIYDKKLKDVGGSVVKLSVTSSSGGEPLVFFAIREGGKVVFQPLRKHKLKSVHEAFGINKK